MLHVTRALRWLLQVVVVDLCGSEPNVEWLRARLSRAVVMDRARAHAAIGEMERCLRLRTHGSFCRRLANMP